MVSNTIQRNPASVRKQTWSAKLRTPFAVLALVADERGLAELHYRPRDEDDQAPTNAIAQQAVRELERYLADPQYRFTVPLAPRGSAFQRRVWDALRAIPVGESRTYGEIAHAVGSAPRPVGQACGANPIALIVPCHRVVGSRGALGGFMHCTSDDAVGVKRWLLEHEGYRFGLF